MSKASRRRQKRRSDYLRKLATEDPARFFDEWTKRLESWAREARENANLLRDGDGNATRSGSDLLAYVTRQLVLIGPEAYATEGHFTHETLMNALALGLASAIDGRMYRVTHSGAVCGRAELYQSKTTREGR